MQPHLAGAAQGGEKQTFTAEEHALEVAGPLDVVVDGRFEGDQAAGVDPQGFVVELALDHGTAGVDEGEAVAAQLFEDEAFAAEEADAEFAVEGDVQLGAEGGAEEGVLLAQHRTADLAQVDGDDLPRIGGGEGDVGFAAAVVGEVGHEQGFAGDHPFAGAEQLAHQAAVGLGAVAHAGLEGDALLHVVHRPGLGDHRLARVQFDHQQLGAGADDFVIHLMTGSGHVALPVVSAGIVGSSVA